MQTDVRVVNTDDPRDRPGLTAAASFVPVWVHPLESHRSAHRQILASFLSAER